MAIIIWPEFVSTSLAKVSEMKSSCNLCGMLIFIAMAVPSAILFLCFFLCVVYPNRFNCLGDHGCL